MHIALRCANASIALAPAAVYRDYVNEYVFVCMCMFVCVCVCDVCMCVNVCK